MMKINISIAPAVTYGHVELSGLAHEAVKHEARVGRTLQTQPLQPALKKHCRGQVGSEATVRVRSGQEQQPGSGRVTDNSWGQVGSGAIAGVRLGHGPHNIQTDIVPYHCPW